PARSLPVLNRRGDAVQVAVWNPAQPWSVVARRNEVPLSDLPSSSWGVWLAREELLALLRGTLAEETGAAGEWRKLHVRAVLGRLFDDWPLAGEDLEAARAVLPPPALAIRSASIDEASDRLARINEAWTAEASWGGLSFQFIPLEA